MNSVTPPPPTGHRKLIGCGVGALVSLLLIAMLFVWLLKFRPEPLAVARALGFCPVDQVHVSPSQSNTIRVFITDGGATGYGGMVIYRKTWLGYDLLFKDNPVVAIPDSHTIEWISEDEFEIRYTVPRYGRGDTTKHIVID